MSDGATAVEGAFRPARPLDLRRTLGPLLRGRGDPAMRLDDRRAWRATRTPDGPATLEVLVVNDRIQLRAWGPGATWAVASAPDLLGETDDPDELRTDQPLIRELARRFGGARIGRTGAVLESLVPAILEQKVTGEAARAAYRGLVGLHGERAPGPLGLRLPPPAEALSRLPYHAYHPFGVERRRADLIRAVSRDARRLEATAGEALPAAYARLRAIPGIGPWTAAEVGLRAYGDPDAVSVGDFHLKNLVVFAFTGRPRGSDDEMLELLEPFRGQRGRVVRLLELSGIRPPAFGPRLSPRRFDRD